MQLIISKQTINIWIEKTLKMKKNLSIFPQVRKQLAGTHISKNNYIIKNKKSLIFDQNTLYDSKS